MKKILIIVLSFVTIFAYSQNKVKLHSHNDYLQNVPFWGAYSNKIESIELDVLLKDNQLYVAHELESIKSFNTIESLYLRPIEALLKREPSTTQEIQFLIDLKSEAYSTMQKLVEVLQHYDCIKSKRVKIVISGNKPLAADYTKYPDFVFFDHQDIKSYDKNTWDKVALVSFDFSKFSVWNGKGRMVDSDLEKVKAVIQKAHSWKKPIRFWASPNSKTAYKVLSDLGVDYINTDNPSEASEYLETLSKLVYTTKTNAPVYVPTYESDGASTKIKNIILLIGDGMGLAQLSSGMFANANDLTITQIMNIGLIKTQSSDDFSTDSAAAATALATGTKTKNRYIGMSERAEKINNITELLPQYGFLSGVITTDQLTGATPGAFYAHQTERDESKKIADDLTTSELSFFAAAAIDTKNLTSPYDLDAYKKAGFNLIPFLDDKKLNSAKIGFFNENAKASTKLKGRQDFLPKSLTYATQFFKMKNKPFFLMVEGALIDVGGHINSTADIVEEVIDFDKAVTAALRFADQNKETLVIVAADHETGGFALPQANIKEKTLEGAFITTDHTGIMVPIFAYGPHSQDFRGVYENTEVFHKIMKIIKKYY